MTEAAKEIYCGADLHGNNVVLSLCDQDGCRLKEKRVKNSIDEIHKTLLPYSDRLKNVAVESTYNWYWFVDGLQDRGIPVTLNNPAQLDAYSGLKESNDYTDARWLAELARLNLLPENYIYPREPRALRDILRRRRLLVRHRTSLLNSLGGWRARHGGIPKKECTSIQDLEDLDLPPSVRFEARILFKAATRIAELIDEIEKEVFPIIRSDPGFQRIQTIKGIGPIIGASIILESGDFSRFPSASNYASYCRTVRSRKLSNGKRKGQKNARNGNPHLAWAFSEAAHFCMSFDEKVSIWFERKRKRSNDPIAYKALASKLSKAVWHVMNGEEYDPERLFR